MLVLVQLVRSDRSQMQSFVDFHGQTLMLVHWSILAYTSVLKILKKHHKRTGLQVQEFNLQQLLSQPFCSVEVHHLAPKCPLQIAKWLFTHSHLEGMLICRQTILHTTFAKQKTWWLQFASRTYKISCTISHARMLKLIAV